MIEVATGPLVIQPETWTLVFSREAATWWTGILALGRYKHVRAYAYVPFLHVWIFYDVHLRGTDIVIAADGEPANRMISTWIRNADLVVMRRRAVDHRSIPAFGFCVPAIKRLLGLRCVSLRPDALYRHCLANGGQPFEGMDGNAEIRTVAA